MKRPISPIHGNAMSCNADSSRHQYLHRGQNRGLHTDLRTTAVDWVALVRRYAQPLRNAVLALCTLGFGFVPVADITGEDQAATAGEEQAVSIGEPRWRICSDRDTALAFQFPYDFYIPDQYKAALRQPHRFRSQNTLTIQPDGVISGDPDGKKIENYFDLASAMYQLRRDETETPDLFTQVLKADNLATPAPEQLSSDGAAKAGTAAIIKQLAGFDPDTITAFDYYKNPEQRLHAEAGWAPEGVSAVLASGTINSQEWSAILLAHDARYYCLASKGSLNDPVIIKMFDSAEIMLDRIGDIGGRPCTRREYLTARDNRVLDHTGKPVRIGRSKPVPWNQAWECETEHYRIITNTSPKRLEWLAERMELLYRTYQALFDLDQAPLFKLEVHIPDSVHTLADIAKHMGYGDISTGEEGTLTGGFFVPEHLALYAYEAEVPGFAINLWSTLTHEATHQFVHAACNGSFHVPTWFNEGLAVYFEQAQAKGKRLSWQPPSDRLNPNDWYQGSTLSKLTYTYGSIPAAMYADSYVMLHFFVFSSAKAKQRFREYWRSLRAGKDGIGEFRRIFFDDILQKHGTEEAAWKALAKALSTYMQEKRPYRQESLK